LLRDLTGTGVHKHDADILIIGAGTAGLLMASRIRKLGRRVVVLESGGVHQHAEENPLNQVIQLHTEYKGATSGRFRCLGGTSTRWGGALIPFQAADMESEVWPVKWKDLDSYLIELEEIFCLTHGLYDVDGVPDDRYSPGQVGKLPPSHEGILLVYLMRISGRQMVRKSG
jgi:choline dehydrogenase-like flavoprotein